MKRCTIGLTIVAMAAQAFAGVTAMSGYAVDTLHDTTGTLTIAQGLDLSEGALWFGQYTAVNRLDLSSQVVAQVGALPGNAGIGAVLRSGGQTYASYDNGYTKPWPSSIGHIGADGNIVDDWDSCGIYDAAVTSGGATYLVSNPDRDGDSNTDGSTIYRYDLATGVADEVAYLGGSSGGLAFDTADNLYYMQSTSWPEANVLCIEAAALAGAGGGNVLALGDTTTVLESVPASFGVFDDDGLLYLGSGSGLVGLYDVDTGAKVADVATGNSIGKMLYADETLYLIDTDWWTYESTIVAINPEPATLTLLALGAGTLLKRRQR